MRERYIGVMSGTSQDGIDAVLAEFHDGHFVAALAHACGHYPESLRNELVELGREATPVSLARYAALDRQVADCFAATVLALLGQGDVDRDTIAAVGSHGQTVFHDADQARSSLQLGDPSRIAALTGLPVVADLRRADIALGGQGAPLLPVFHHARLASDTEPRAVLNLGGIANLTVLPGLDPAQVRGFDCGPASCLMDEWIERHCGRRFDDDGAWAAGGERLPVLEARVLADPYFARPIPKSTGRGLFNLDWVRARDPDLERYRPVDVQRSLCEVSVLGVVEALRDHAPQTRRLIVCGGGTRNGFLMARLGASLPTLQVDSTAAHGLDPQWVEAACFAWLACRRMRGEPGNLPSVTGASRPAVLGGIYAP